MRIRRSADLAPLQDPALAALHRALNEPASQQELTDEPRVLAEYRAVSWDRRRWFRPAVWRPAVITSVLATKLGVVAVASAVGLGGTAAAAYTGKLPNTLQDIAHRTIKAPPAHAVGPDATGPAAHGLCQAFAKDKGDQEAKDKQKAAERAAEKAAEQAREGAKPKATDKPGQGVGRGNGNGKDDGQDKARGQSKERSVAYRNLVRAAGGEDKVEAYCAAVPKPSDAPKASAEPKQSGKPSKAPATKPTKQPAPSRTGGASEPTSSPSPEPTVSATTTTTASAEPTATTSP